VSYDTEHSRASRPLYALSDDVTESDNITQQETVPITDATDKLSVPFSFNDMVSMTTKACSDAYRQGITRQIIRLLLPRDPSSSKLGQYFESDARTDRFSANMVLVPPDETWQGGIMQLYRAALPTCMQILRRLSPNPGGLPPKINEDRSVDESGVDGVGLLVTESTTPEDDASCFIQPTQETVSAIESVSSQAGNRLVMLMNPQWRSTDDALDSASMGGGFLGGLASFLGGKGGSLKRLDDIGYQSVFTVEGYVCKGGNVRLVKRFDSDWAVFAENDDATGFVKVGTSKTRPTYQEVDKMMDDKGITLKYARDFGLAPRL